MTQPDATSNVAATLALKAGEYLFREGERHGSLFVIERGQVELTREADGRSQPLALLGPGDVAGEDCAFGRRAAGCSARAVVDAEVVRVRSAAFHEVLRARPEVGAQVIASLGRRLLEARAACLADPIGEPGVAREGMSAIRPSPGARLVHEETGSSFPLSATADAVVGRADPRTRFKPDIELSALDLGRSLSRRHAVVSRQGDGFVVTEESHVANGTFVNGERLKPGVPAPIKDGDEVSFGLVRTVFRTT